MARIRTIKPEFFRSPAVAHTSPWARLLFIAMWCWADDHGRAEWTPRELLGFAFPHDTEAPCTDAEFPTLLAEVARNFSVEFYTVGERRFYAILSWEEHQRNQRRAKSRYPGPDDPETVHDKGICGSSGNAAPTRGSSAHPDGRTAPGTGEHRNIGTGENTPLPLADATGSGGVTDPQPDHFADFWDAFPKRVDKRAAAKAFKAASKRADPAAIIAGARRYASECETNRTETRFIKHPTTWLNADAWDNPELINGPIKDNRQKRIDDMTLGAIKRGTEGRNAFAVLLPPDDGGAS